MRDAVGQQCAGGMKNKVFEVLNRAKGEGQTSNGKLMAMNEIGDDGKATGHVWREPSDVLHYAHKYGEMVHQAAAPCSKALTQVL